MNISLRALMVILTVAFAFPQIASAQAVTSFDGTYKGVSNTTNGGHCVAAGAVPPPMTISNGEAQFVGGLSGNITWRGTVTAQGYLTMRSNTGALESGKIAGGKVTIGSSNGPCTITSVWQK
jgi:hypothetical protein